MAKVPFVVFSLALVLSIQFVVGHDEKALDEAASSEAEDALLSSGVAKLVENFKSSAGDDSQIGQDEKAFDEVASPEAEEVLLSLGVLNSLKTLKALLEMIPRAWRGQLPP
ncbi:hypothetical protein PVK06_000141 [Gossypium arboreum]|uniref:Uncharacterized protein n=1 Tax=Gossypium arboreum TaxID=29729 RepID=A0ABR0QXH5_GOSAR|nr:hypothetical protein PVK06_000141 [Gossypium arboreum]